MKLYTFPDLERAYKMGRMKGQADLTGDDHLYPGPTEMIDLVKPILDVPDYVVEDVKRKQNIKRLSNQIALSPRIIVSAILLACGEIAWPMTITRDILTRPSRVATTQKTREVDDITIPRLIGYLLVYLHTTSTFNGIGTVFGSRNPDTIRHGVHSMNGAVKTSNKAALLHDKVISILIEWDYDVTPLPQKLRMLNSK